MVLTDYDVSFYQHLPVRSTHTHTHTPLPSAITSAHIFMQTSPADLADPVASYPILAVRVALGLVRRRHMHYVYSLIFQTARSGARG